MKSTTIKTLKHKKIKDKVLLLENSWKIYDIVTI